MQIRRVARSTVVEFMAYCHRSFLFARRTASRVFIDRRAPTAGNRLSPPPVSLDHETFKFARRSREKKGEGEKKENRRNTRLDEVVGEKVLEGTFS